MLGVTKKKCQVGLFPENALNIFWRIYGRIKRGTRSCKVNVDFDLSLNIFFREAFYFPLFFEDPIEVGFVSSPDIA